MFPNILRGGVAAAALSAGTALAASGIPVPATPSPVEAVQYYCPPGYHFSYRMNACRPNRPPPPPAYYAPPPRYYPPPPPPVYYAPPPRYYAPPPPPGPGVYFRF